MMSSDAKICHMAIIIERRVCNIFNIQFSFPVQLSLMPDSIVVGRDHYHIYIHSTLHLPFKFSRANHAK